MGAAALAASVVIVTVLCVPVGTLGQEGDLEDRIRSKESELQKLRKGIADARRSIADIEKKAKSEESYLEELRREEELTRKLLDGLSEKEGMLTTQVESLRKALETNETVYRHRLEVLAKRLRSMYKDGPRHIWQELLDASDFADLLHRYKFLTRIAENDASLVEDVRNRRAEIERQEANITELLHQVTVSRREKEGELARLEENEKKRKRTLGELGKRKKQYERKIEELAESERELQKFIEVLEQRRIEQAQAWGAFGERDFFKLKGKLTRPVEGKTVRQFGRFKHPEFGTVTFNTGIDVETRTGSPVKAVARGRVEYASVLPGYGNCIIVNHGGGYYSLYAHASRIFVGQGDQVERGDVIAEAGGGMGTAGQFHFEIRKSKKALDPDEWLVR
jgi:septal ring factor EnvC (AmiA/AmiB activator)